MANLITGEIDNLFRENMTSLLDNLGNKSTFVIVLPAVFTECPNCIFDPVAKASSGVPKPGAARPFSRICPVCRGKGDVGVETKRRIPNTIVTWLVKEENIPTPLGEQRVEHARCKLRVQFASLVDQASYFLIDGRRCRIVGVPKKRGLKTFVVVEILVKLDE